MLVRLDKDLLAVGDDSLEPRGSSTKEERWEELPLELRKEVE